MQALCGMSAPDGGGLELFQMKRPDPWWEPVRVVSTVAKISGLSKNAARDDACP
ncbi:MAG TPA: hypothetical protein VFA20_30435 [Myxococcaceae bacterium]|nr:hypothetical protein [Myxococcaceae bacterium]